MTLLTYDIPQGAPEWDELRRGIVTASVVKGLVTPSTIQPAENTEARAIVAQLVAERITGFSDSGYVSFDMERGWDDEARAIEKYNEHYAAVDPLGFMVREEPTWTLGYSPDGLVGDDGLIEIKSRRPKKHLQTILADDVPSENVAQIQAGLLVSGRKWCDFISYCGGMPMWVKRVEPDPRWQEALVTAVEQFELAAAVMQATYTQATKGLAQTERVDPITVELKL